MKFFAYFIMFITFMILDDAFNFSLWIYALVISFITFLFTVSSLKADDYPPYDSLEFEYKPDKYL